MNYLDLQIPSDLKKIADWAKPLGPITMSYFKKTLPPEPEWWVGSFKFGHNPVGLFHTKKMTAAAGTSIAPEEALIRTIGEGIERYCCVNSHLTDQFEMALPDPGLDFTRCADFEPCQESFKRTDGEQPIEHTWVKRLSNGEQVLVPAEQVHLGVVRYNFANMHTAPISTGCAFYPDINVAIWKGLCEVVERDAMMNFWYTRSQPIRINTQRVQDTSLLNRIKRIENAGLEIRLFEISNAIAIPTIFAVIPSEDFPYYCVGASCDTDIIKACNKAIDEVMSIRIMANWNGYKQDKEQDLNDFSWVNSLEKHMELYANWKNSPAFDFFINQRQTITLQELQASKPWLEQPKNQQELKQLAATIEKQGFDVYWKEVTIPDVESFGHVVKVLIPQAIPLAQSFTARWLEPFKDLYHRGHINPYPHPFA